MVLSVVISHTIPCLSPCLSPPSHPGTVTKPYSPIQTKPMRYLPLPKSSKPPSKSGNPMQGTASAIDRAYLYRRYIQPMPYIEYSRSGSRWSIQSAPPTHPSIRSSIHSSIHRPGIAGCALVKISWHVCRSDILNWPTAPLRTGVVVVVVVVVVDAPPAVRRGEEK